MKGKVEAGKAYVKGKVEKGKEWVKAKAKAGLEGLRALRDRMLGITFRQKFSAGGEEHEVFTRKGEPQVLYTASKKPKRSAQAVSDAKVAELDAEFKENMTQYWTIASGMTGAASDNAIIRQAGKFKSKADQLLKEIVALTRKAMDAGHGPQEHAPGIGEAAPHRMQSARLRGSEGIPHLRMESEHLVPRELISTYFSTIRESGAEVKDAEYNAMVTILMYENASKAKTTTAGTGDLASIRKMKALVVKKRQEVLAKGGSPDPGVAEPLRSAMLAELTKRGKDAAARAWAAVKAERSSVGDVRGKGADPRPNEAQIANAYNAQVDQVQDMITLRMEWLAGQNEPGTDDATAVKEQARGALRSQARQKFPTLAALEALLKRVQEPLRPKGLKSLDAVPRKNHRGSST